MCLTCGVRMCYVRRAYEPRTPRVGRKSVCRFLEHALSMYVKIVKKISGRSN